MGDALADEVKRIFTEQNISVDVVIPVSGECLGGSFTYTQTFRSGARYIPCCCAKPGSENESPLPRGIHQKSIRWANIHHAWPTDEVGRGLGCSYLVPNVLPGVRTFAKS